MRPTSWVPLRLDHIEARPKTLVFDLKFIRNVELSRRQEEDFVAIANAIRSGSDLARFYRKFSGHDRLLHTHAVLHLHLGGPASDAILYVMQYPDTVVALLIDTHVHLDDKPPGKRLDLRGTRALQKTLQDAAERRRIAIAQALARLNRR